MGRAGGRARSLSSLAPLGLLASVAGLLWLERLVERPLSLLALLGCGFGCLLVAVRGEAPLATKPVAILAVGAALRLIVLPLPPTLSDDVLRYLWDGKVLVAGFNPYALPPDSAKLQLLRDENWEQMSHRDVETVYPPLAMVAFSIPAFFRWPLLGYKALLVLADLLACALVLRLARRWEVPFTRTVWYVWNPLVVLEGAGMGHVDAFGVPCVAATLLLLGRSGDAARRAARVPLAATAAAAGVLVKLVPIVCLPLWTARSARRVKFLVLALGVLAAGILPVLWSVSGVPPGLVTYGVSWEFNGLVFEPLWRLLDVAGAEVAVKGLLDAVKGLSGWHDLWNPVYPYVYPQLLAKLILGAALLAVVVSGARYKDDLLSATRRIMGGAVLCSATLYPWYLLWVLPWAALTGSAPWLVLSASVCLSYLPRLMGVAPFPETYLLVWTPFVLSHLVAWRRRGTA